jgi:hypothetical protein
MSYLKAMWVGIEQKQAQTIQEQLERKYQDRKMVGVVIRSGYGKQCGHFMYWTVSINGKKVTASGAEDRIFPFHHVTLEPYDPLPKDMIPALGFCNDGNDYAFNYKGKPCIITKAAICGMEHGFEPVPKDRWPEKWEVK